MTKPLSSIKTSSNSSIKNAVASPSESLWLDIFSEKALSDLAVDQSSQLDNLRKDFLKLDEQIKLYGLRIDEATSKIENTKLDIVSTVALLTTLIWFFAISLNLFKEVSRLSVALWFIWLLWSFLIFLLASFFATYTLFSHQKKSELSDWLKVIWLIFFTGAIPITWTFLIWNDIKQDCALVSGSWAASCTKFHESDRNIGDNTNNTGSNQISTTPWSRIR